MGFETASGYAYFDYAATAPLIEEAASAMAPYAVPGPTNLQCNGNANSLHSPGRAAFAAMEDARKRIARAIGARRPDEVMFTSGATEADNAALLGLAHALRAKGARERAAHVITTAIEHDAVLEPARRLEAQGFRVTFLRPDSQGFVSPDALAAVIDDDTVLVSVQAANSEVGSIEPIAELARIAHEHGALMHTDAVQAFGKVAFDVRALDVDAASFSAHKIGGPKGIGAMYLRARTPFEPFMLGGGQESARRSGTQNVAGAVGFAAAAEAASARTQEEIARLSVLRDRLYERLSVLPRVSPTVQVAPGSTEFLPNIVHVLIDGFESETLILRLDDKGFGVSGGSACASRSLEPSHVLKAMGVQGDRALGALRVSMGRYTTEAEVDALIAAIGECIGK